MKAKEHYENFLEVEKEKGKTEATFELLIGFFNEVKEIMKMRNAQSNLALISILKEQNRKWNALRKFDKRFKFDGFMEYTKHKFPFLRDELKKEA